MNDAGGQKPSTIERAYQLARSGTCRSIEDIRIKLVREGYESVQAHLSGPSLKRDLSTLYRAAIATPAEE